MVTDATVLEYGSLSLPYYDVTTASILRYTGLIPGTTDANIRDYDNPINMDDLSMWWSNSPNKANPDWQYQIDLSTAFGLGPITGTFNPPFNPAITTVACQVFGPLPPYIDFWWGQSQFAKYGVFFWGALGVTDGPQWLNMPIQGFYSSRYQVGFTLITQPLVYISMITWRRLPLPEIIFAGNTATAPN
jgi:hypothetical protein